MKEINRWAIVAKLRVSRKFLAVDLVLTILFNTAFLGIPSTAFSATAPGILPSLTSSSLTQITPPSASGSNQAKPVLTNASKAPAGPSRAAGAVTASAAGISPTASRVYGQPNFTSNSTDAGGSVSASGLDLPQGVASDSAGGVYVSDWKNNRVLYYSPNTTVASRVYGQSNFSSNSPNQGTGAGGPTHLYRPEQLSYDPSTGGLYVADYNNNRVLFYPAGSTSATRAFGQPDLYSVLQNDGNGTITATATGLSLPSAASPDNLGGLYIADTYNNRVVYYPSGSGTATRVYGQPDFSALVSNNGGVSATSLSYPTGVAFDPSTGGLYVADYNNNRVLFYPAGSTTATAVYGQPNFTSNAPANGNNGISATTLSLPGAVAVSSTGNLFVADTQNNRVLFYTKGSTTATGVWGQPDFTSLSSNLCCPSANTLTGPGAVALDLTSGGLLVADSDANRALYYPVGSSLAAPTNLTYTPDDSSHLTLHWTDNATNEDGYSLEFSFDGTTNWSQFATVGANSTSAQLTVTEGAIYYFRIRAYNSSDYSAYSNVIAAACYLNDPTNLTSTSVSYRSITLTWTDNSNHEAGYRIERSLDGATGWTLVGTVGVNVTSYTDNGVMDGTAYYYRVYAFNSLTYSQHFTNVFQTVTPLAGPAGLYAAAFSSTQVNLYWQNNSGSATSYSIERSTSPTSGFVAFSPVTAPSQSFVDQQGLAPDTVYYYRLRAFNSVAGYSGYSAVVRVVTTLVMVTQPEDNGAGNVQYTLSYALTHSAAGESILVSLNSGATTIQFTGNLPATGLPNGVNLLGACNSGPGYIIDGSGITGDGLILNGNNFLWGMKITHFGGRQILTNASPNRLMCVSAIK